MKAVGGWRRPIARGVKSPDRPGYTQVVVVLDDDTFAAVRARAVREETSFGEQLRLLVEWGLEAAAE